MRGNTAKVLPEQQNNRKGITVEHVVKRVEDEIEEIALSADNLIKGIYESAADIPDVSSETPLYNRSQRTNINSHPTRGATQVTAVRRPTITRSSKSQVEEVKLSHDLLATEDDLAEGLDAKFKTLQQQLTEYRKLYQGALEKLKENENKINELEEKVDLAEEEKQQLEETIRNNADGTQGPGGYALSDLGKVNNRNRPKPGVVDDLQKRSEDLRRALLFEDESEVVISFDSLLKSRNVLVVLKEYIAQLKPFKRDIRMVQARFGSSVASYFLFYRYLFLESCVIGVVTMGFFLWHLIQLSYQGISFSTYFTATGYIPYVMSFSSFSSSEAIYYDVMLVMVSVYSLISIWTKLVEEDRKAKDLGALEQENVTPYSKEILAAWDFSLTTTAEIDDLCGSYSNVYLQNLEESKTKGIKRARDKYELLNLYTRRVVGGFSFICLVSASFAIILYVTIYGQSISKVVKNVPGLSNVNSLIAPFILNVLNSVLPTLLSSITEFEDWDSAETASNLVLFRLYLASTANALLTVFSYLVLADPFLMATSPKIRNSFGLKKNTAYNCVMDQVASGLFTLVSITWAIDQLNLIFTPIFLKYYAFAMRQPYSKPQFLVADHMVKRLGFCGLAFASLAFCPFTLIFQPLFIGLAFKLNKNVIKYLYSKPKRPWKGQKAGLVYTSFYFVSWVLVGLSVVCYFLTSKTFPKDCNIQDNAVNLCASVVDSTTNTCVMNPASAYYAYYSGSEYPKAICEQACGPFTASSSNFSPLQITIAGNYIADTVWSVFFSYPYMPWVLAMILSVTVAMLKNSLDIVRLAANHKERVMEAHILAVEAERTKQDRIIKKLKSIEDTADDEDRVVAFKPLDDSAAVMPNTSTKVTAAGISSRLNASKIS